MMTRRSAARRLNASSAACRSLIGDFCSRCRIVGGLRMLQVADGPKHHDRKLADQPVPGTGGTVVAPSDQPAEHALDNGCEPLVAPLVVSERRCGLSFVEDTVDGPEPSAADGDLDRRMGLHIAVPVGPFAQAGHDETRDILTSPGVGPVPTISSTV